MNIEQFVKENLNGSDRFRSDCPVCGNRNTFSASYVDGVIQYYCFHSGCSLKGRFDKDISLGELKNERFHARNTVWNNDRNLDKGPFVIPDYWLNPLQNEHCYNFLKYWKILEVYRNGQVSIWYDPKQQRCVFLIKDGEGNVRGATGRALYRATSPKWYVYSRFAHCPGILKKNSVPSEYRCILCEDFISACTGLFLWDTVALLGTTISTDTISYIIPYQEVYIALDPDATHKSLKIKKQLDPYVEKCVILQLKDDLKYYSQSELEELKKEIVHK